ncbi:hypothetical protein [Archangium sp.]|uniref:hypothetical protein n=1 Tax=Archangium sp. TaxID=1872627 RepID=UPI002D3394F6|nr:hypothetical protein [Archangium sp.]HYO53514.1 hypothetical protein [Archangium sp.]
MNAPSAPERAVETGGPGCPASARTSRKETPSTGAPASSTVCPSTSCASFNAIRTSSELW